VTGYDFLADAAQAVQGELQAGLGQSVDALIAPRNISPEDPAAWTAVQLRSNLLETRHDLIFLAGHFSANSALAADYKTRLSSSELMASSVDLKNAIIFSAGCHAGYNIVDAHGVPGVTGEPDWAQAFARKGVTLIAGTGYQYGDTDFIEYSERLYLDFAKQLRVGTGAVSVGQAFIAAKQKYLADTPLMQGLHQKAWLEATIFGFPMLKVNLPAGRGTGSGDSSIVGSTTAYSTNPGATLGLRRADVSVNPSLTTHNVMLKDPVDGTPFTATYLSGGSGVTSSPTGPVLPVESRNVGVANQVLRGVGFRGGEFSETSGIRPLTGAATTEIRGMHVTFLSDIFFPIRLWTINYFEALAGSNGATRLVLTPAQLQSSAPGSLLSTLRSFNKMNLRLFYSNNVTTYGGNSVPASSDAPSITSVSSVVNGSNVNFGVRVVGNPAAGIQEVWVTYSATTGPFAGKWQSLDLTQNAGNSTLWEGTLPLGTTAPQNVRFIVQAVNGVGLVSLDTNLGAYYVPAANPANLQPTTLMLEIPTSSGPYGTQATFSAVLTSNGAPVAGQTIKFGLSSQRRQALTDSNGRATVVIPLLVVPGQHEVRATFAATNQYQTSTTTAPFTIVKQNTALVLNPQPAIGVPDAGSIVVATLTDASGRRLGEKTVFFVVSGSGGTYQTFAITDYAGRAVLGHIPLPSGTYNVTAKFSGLITVSGQTFDFSDDRYNPSTTSGTLILNSPPDCSKAHSSIEFIWPPNGEFYSASVLGVTDPDGDPVTITINGIFQDELVGSQADAHILGVNLLDIRSERDGSGDGRVYHAFFTASDGRGGTCSSQVRIGITPHDQGVNLDAIDGGPLYNSTVPSP